MNKFIFVGALFVLVAGLLIIAQPSSANLPAAQSISQALCDDTEVFGQGQATFGNSLCNPIPDCEANIPAGGCTTAICQQFTGGACIYRCGLPIPPGHYVAGGSCTSGRCNSEGNACLP